MFQMRQAARDQQKQLRWKQKTKQNKVIPKQTGNDPSNSMCEPIHIYSLAYPVSKQNDVGENAQKSIWVNFYRIMFLMVSA